MTTTVARSDLATELAQAHDIDHAAAAEAIETYAEQLGAQPGDLTAEDADHVRRALETHLAQDARWSLDAVYEATAAKQAIKAAAAEADREWRRAIRQALREGERVVAIAEAASISRERVYQIRDDRR